MPQLRFPLRRATARVAACLCLTGAAGIGSAALVLPAHAASDPVVPVTGHAQGTAKIPAHARTTYHSLHVPAVAVAALAARPSGSARSVAPLAARHTTLDPVVSRLTAHSTAPFGVVGVTWAAGFPDGDLTVQVRTHAVGSGWSSWQRLPVDEDGPGPRADTRDGTAPTWVGDADGVAVRLRSADGTSPSDVKVAVIDGGTGLAVPTTGHTVGDTAAPTAAPTSETVDAMARPALARTGVVTAVNAVATTSPSASPSATLSQSASPSATVSPTSTASPSATASAMTVAVAASGSTLPNGATGTTIPRPPIVTRKAWGVDTSTEVSCSSPRYSSEMDGIILHHTVNANDYTEAQAPGIVRAIHRYHTEARGWCDIGYNFLVDRFGNIYQGRRGGIDRQVRGAHAGNWDVNLHTTGISMIGNFDKIAVPKAMEHAVVKLMAWRLDFWGHPAGGFITFGGHTMHRISGHRDVALAGIKPSTATACPGRYAYEWLNGGLRKSVKAIIDSAPAKPAPSPSASPSPTPTTPPPPVTSRMAGQDRYATSTQISESTFTGTVKSVFLAAGTNYPDALSAGPAAAQQASPVLLVRPHGIPGSTLSELKRLAPQTIYILGGTGAIDAGVAAEAAQYAASVVRLAGSNRYKTAVAIAKHFWPTSDTVYVASGGAYPDALSGGALAARKDAPILLSATAHLPRPVGRELEQLHPTRVVLLGGPAALSDTILSAVKTRAPSAAVSRLAGANRYATSAAIAKAGWSTSDQALFATGVNFPDALSGVPSAARKGAPLLLARDGCLPGPVFTEKTDLAPQTMVLLGGADVLADATPHTRCQ